MQVLMKLVTTEFSFRLNCVLRNFEQKSHICSFIDYFSFSDNSEKNRHSSKTKQVRIIIGSALLVMGILKLGVISYVWKKKISFKGKAINMNL